ncbi:MAG TPA: phytanoyl-CoA dioxygenase family protein [Planctomycetota bacterium]|nr:phytanoyl-CoA dioxygenase family protein [Planctomycetota bacterium]
MQEQPRTATAAYERDGFAIVPGAVPADVVATASAAAHEIAAGRYASGLAPLVRVGPSAYALTKIDDAHIADARLRDLVVHPTVAAAARAATGAGALQLWASQLLMKPPGGGGASHVGWHQDFHYWRYWAADSELMTVWIALSEVTAAMGPMVFIVGSHRWGYRGLGEFFADQESSAAATAAPDGGAVVERPVLLPPGGLSVHHPLTVHGSGANRSSATRVSIALHLRGAHARPTPDARDWYVDRDRLADGWRCPWL